VPIHVLWHSVEIEVTTIVLWKPEYFYSRISCYGIYCNVRFLQDLVSLLRFFMTTWCNTNYPWTQDQKVPFLHTLIPNIVTLPLLHCCWNYITGSTGVWLWWKSNPSVVVIRWNCFRSVTLQSSHLQLPLVCSSSTHKIK